MNPIFGRVFARPGVVVESQHENLGKKRRKIHHQQLQQQQGKVTHPLEKSEPRFVRTGAFSGAPADTGIISTAVISAISARAVMRPTDLSPDSITCGVPAEYFVSLLGVCARVRVVG